MSVGAKIRDARIRKGLTQEQLGSILGVQKSAIAKWETGRVVNIKRSKLQQLADVLDIPAYELVSPDSVGMSQPEENPTITKIKQMLPSASEEQLAQIEQYMRFVLRDK